LPPKIKDNLARRGEDAESEVFKSDDSKYESGDYSSIPIPKSASEALVSVADSRVRKRRQGRSSVDSATYVGEVDNIDQLPRDLQEVVWTVRELLAAKTAECDLRAEALVKENGLTADRVYDRIHEAGRHEFSRVGLKPNNFMYEFAEEADIREDSLIAVAADGFFRDTPVALERGAKAIYVDSSEVAVEAAREEAKKSEYARNVALCRMNIADFLQDPAADLILPRHFIEDHFLDFRPGRPVSDYLTHFYIHSGAHYNTPHVYRNRMLKRMRDMVAKNKGSVGIAMKTNNSASAEDSRHVWLSRNDGRNMKLDLKDLIVRSYMDRETQEDDFKTTFCHYRSAVQHIIGYDKSGEVEEFVNTIGRTTKS
jgi:hypothetical protein